MPNNKDSTSQRRSARLQGLDPPATPSIATSPATPRVPRKPKGAPVTEPESPTPRRGRKRKEPEPDPEPAAPEPKRRGRPRKAAPANINTGSRPDLTQPAPVSAGSTRRPPAAANPYADRGADRAAAETRPRGVFQIGSFTIGAPSITIDLAQDAAPAASAGTTYYTAPEEPVGDFNSADPTGGYAAAERHFRAARERAAEIRRVGPDYDPNEPAADMPEAVWRFQTYGEFRLYCVRPDRLQNVPNPRHFPDPFW